MMNKLKIIIGLVATISLFLQCQCGYRSNNPLSAFGSREAWIYNSSEVKLVDNWTTVDATWNFKDGGELTITSQAGVTNAYWIDGEKTLEIIINGESTLYNVELLSATKIKLYTGTEELILEK